MQFCPETPLMNIPEAYSTKMMMNIQMGSYPGKSISFFEAADNNLMKALILSFGGFCKVCYKHGFNCDIFRG